MTPRRVVISGMGTICPVAHNVKDFWTKLVEGKSGVGIIDRFDPSDFPTKIAAQVKDFSAQDYMP
ncbi:MAG: beta-ketoacyl synthase N-terminal-like domain-containing protein, partial [Syntrophomonas sp.]|nr:beta-ketoacyl synthase N-terminal-like domain-containing protein [Syntrophomonas sp.]